MAFSAGFPLYIPAQIRAASVCMPSGFHGISMELSVSKVLVSIFVHTGGKRPGVFASMDFADRVSILFFLEPRVNLSPLPLQTSPATFLLEHT
jgi:hypothetical protein